MKEDQPSSTAILIALATVFISKSRSLHSLVPQDAALWCVRSLKEISPRLLTLIHIGSLPPFRWILKLAEWATIPDLPLHFILRKRLIEDFVRNNILNGDHEVIFFGAGFDTLGLRLSASFPNVRFIEIDHPSTQNQKRRIVQKYDRDNALSLLSGDLACENISDILSKDPSFQPQAPSTLIIEGLFMYLTEEEIDRIFQSLHSIFTSPTHIIFTMMETTPDGRSTFHQASGIVSKLLSHWREPFKSSLKRTSILNFLTRHQWSLCEICDHETLRNRYLSPKGLEGQTLAKGELVIIAKKIPTR